MTVRQSAARALIGATLAVMSLFASSCGTSAKAPVVPAAEVGLRDVFAPFHATRLDLGNWSLSRRGLDRRSLYGINAIRQDEWRKLHSARDLACLVRSLRSPEDVRAFYEIVERWDLREDESDSWARGPAACWWASYDLGMVGRQHATYPDPWQETGWILAVPGGFLVERRFFDGKGGIIHARVYLAPGVYRVENAGPVPK